jgi:hypothetical protein
MGTQARLLRNYDRTGFVLVIHLIGEKEAKRHIHLIGQREKPKDTQD